MCFARCIIVIMIIAGEIKVLCRVLILPAFCVFMLQTLPLMGATRLASG